MTSKHAWQEEHGTRKKNERGVLEYIRFFVCLYIPRLSNSNKQIYAYTSTRLNNTNRTVGRSFHLCIQLGIRREDGFSSVQTPSTP